MIHVAPLLLALLTMLPLDASEQTAIETTRKLTAQLFERRQFADVAAACDDRMQEVFPERGVAQLYQQITFQLGAYEKELGVTTKQADNHTAVTQHLKFERGEIKLRMVINAEQKLAGIWMDDFKPVATYEPPDYASPDRFRETELKLGPEDAPLGATLTIPNEGGPHPCVILVHGSGPHDRDEQIGPNKIFKDLAWGLASRGIAVLRYEKRTKTYPNARPNEEITLDYETIDDAVAGARLVREQDGIDGERIFVLGHSLGAYAAPFISNKDGKLRGVILMGGPARPIDVLAAEQLKYLRRAQRNELTAQQRTDTEETIQRLEEIARGKLPEGNILGIAAVYWKNLRDYPVLEATEKLTLPILILHGRRDYQVSMRDYAIWKEKLEPKPNVTLKLYRDLNHLMISGTGPSLPSEYTRGGHVALELVDDLAGWIQQESDR